MDRILAAAKIIANARRKRTRLASLPADTIPQDEDEAYRVQRAVHDLLLPQTGAMAGYKIGCTSAVMQEYLDISHPCSGGVFENGIHDSGVSLQASDYVRVGVECEIAVRLARNLSPGEAPFTAEWMMEAIRSYHPRSRSSTTATSNGDDGRADARRRRFLRRRLRARQTGRALNAPNLLHVAGRAVINGKEVGRGTGADVLGHPHNALAWLANHLAAEGKGLHAGQIVLTGSLVKTVWLKAGDDVVMELEGLGQVAAKFT
jgi:2-oxo-3-hexenedioate decarboxylase/2-keto-4-pentenoate hydratase